MSTATTFVQWLENAVSWTSFYLIRLPGGSELNEEFSQWGITDRKGNLIGGNLCQWKISGKFISRKSIREKSPSVGDIYEGEISVSGKSISGKSISKKTISGS